MGGGGRCGDAPKRERNQLVDCGGAGDASSTAGGGGVDPRISSSSPEYTTTPPAPSLPHPILSALRSSSCNSSKLYGGPTARCSVPVFSDALLPGTAA